jgi:flavin reductase (DIM6/NTAB) family NADH-FMN oxidoreductase RutF
MATPFAEIADRLEYPMFIVTTATDETRAGCLVGFSTQCSIDPGRFLVLISDKNRTHRVAMQARTLVVHLAPDEHFELAELFGGETGDEVDKFERCRWRPGPDGAPILEGCPSWFAGPIVDRFELGDHTAFVIEPSEGEAGGGRALNVQKAMAEIEPGHDA